MRRLALLAVASLAFIAISEPPSAEARGKSYQQCTSGCNDKIAEKYGSRWSYGDLAPADQRSWVKCIKKCEATDSAPTSGPMQGKFRTRKECNNGRCKFGCDQCKDGSFACSSTTGRRSCKLDRRNLD
tara:strand:+ start:93 stop:476 length:384 start_codon:yes stop_codon:yes gene_type:complete